MVLETQDTGQCLGFTLTYFDGSGFQTFNHHQDGLTSQDNVVSNLVTFSGTTFLAHSKISHDTNYPGQSIAFEFSLNDNTKLDCGHLDDSALVVES